MIGVVAHTARQQQAEQLADTVAAEYLSIDDGTLGCNGNHRHVWAHGSPNTTTDEWSIVLEDDAIPVPNFVRTSTPSTRCRTRACRVASTSAATTSPNIDWERRKQDAITHADRLDAHFITSNHLLHAVAIACTNRRTSHSMLAHINMTTRRVLPIDEAITHWMQNFRPRRRPTPGHHLVNHADQPTLFRHPDKMDRPPGRIAYRTGQRNHWTDKAVTM
jgi:hypothetical protein